MKVSQIIGYHARKAAAHRHAENHSSTAPWAKAFHKQKAQEHIDMAKEVARLHRIKALWEAM